MPITAANGIIAIPSLHSVDETVERLKRILHSRDITLFAVVDHSGEAQKAGLWLPNTKLVIFGKPSGGTPLMQRVPSIAIDLPLKILVAEDERGEVTVSWTDPWYLQQRHGFPAELVQNIAGIEALARAAAG